MLHALGSALVADQLQQSGFVEVWHPQPARSRQLGAGVAADDDVARLR
jgi:hypothetical protein